ncbi:hypothetical protein ACJMK2_024238 [Sinanodonta woodiana]|uniref:pyridoxal 5'-phosphate synthase n=1 Tax=Sinanodonta woodiana TaxID=1069815 RepID=A0ABD3T6R6_SINWO
MSRVPIHLKVKLPFSWIATRTLFPRLFSQMADLSGMRKPYHSTEDVFDIDHLISLDPLQQFNAWLHEACKDKTILEPNAMALATATKDGVPSVRMILMKGFDVSGFRFFTNYNSRKAIELNTNPRVSLMFYWEPLKKSVRIEGTVEKLSEEKSTEYFSVRPKDSQLGALASNQSSVISGRDALLSKYKELQEQYAQQESVPKPEFWGGYVVKPFAYEFWQGQTNRLHDRLRFRKLREGELLDESVMHKGEDGWVIERLCP